MPEGSQPLAKVPLGVIGVPALTLDEALTLRVGEALVTVKVSGLPPQPDTALLFTSPL